VNNYDTQGLADETGRCITSARSRELVALGKPISHSDASLRTITLVALGKPISHSDASLRTITIRKALPMRLGDALPLPDLESSLHWVSQYRTRMLR
jgi:hypothetical protein